MSRPRRFGKSLLLDTIQELFEGEPVHLVGIEFSSEERALVDFKTETVG